MGRIFSYGEVSERHVPRTEDFPAAAKMLCERLALVKGVVAGMLCGSFVFKGATIRSDLDCLVLYERSMMAKAFEALQGISREAALSFVPIDWIPLGMDMAQTRMHNIGPSFRCHLQKAAECSRIIKRNPLSIIIESGINPQEELQSYLQRKFHSLQRAAARLPAMGDWERCLFLRKAFEAPIHIARKLLWYRSIRLPNDSKKEVAQAYLSVAGAGEAASFTSLIELDDRYSKELSLQLPQPNNIRYRSIMGDLQNAIPEILGFVWSCCHTAL